MDVESIEYSKFQLDTLPLKNIVVKYVPLSLDITSSIREVSKIMVRDGVYYLGDFILNKIVAVNDDGELLFTINKRGHGSGEYLELRNFTIDDTYIYILDNLKRQIHTFDRLSGQYIISKDTKGLIPQDIACVKDGFIICVIPMNAKFAVEQNHYLLQICDKDFNIKKQLLPYNDNQSEGLGKRFYFTYSGKDIIFSSYLNDAYYQIPYENPSNICLTRVDFEYQMGKAERSVLDNYGNPQFQYLLETPLICNKWIYLQVYDKGSYVCRLYNNDDGNMYINQDIYVPLAVDEGKLISVIENSKNKAKYLQGLPENDSLFNGSLILVEYEL